MLYNIFVNQSLAYLAPQAPNQMEIPEYGVIFLFVQSLAFPPKTHPTCWCCGGNLFYLYVPPCMVYVTTRKEERVAMCRYCSVEAITSLPSDILRVSSFCAPVLCHRWCCIDRYTTPSCQHGYCSDSRPCDWWLGGDFKTIIEAKIALGIKIKSNRLIEECLAEERESAYGYEWFYEKELLKNII